MSLNDTGEIGGRQARVYSDAAWDDLRAENERLRQAIERAYGCLWRSLDLDAKSCHARKLLLAEIDKNGQRRGITYAQQKYGSVSDHEMLMGPDLPL